MRTRVELYATAFKAGAKKSRTAIMQTLKPLDLVPEHLWQGLGRQGRAYLLRWMTVTKKSYFTGQFYWD